MSKRKKEIINRVGKVRSRGWKLQTNKDLNKIEPHSGKETTRHFLVKATICNILSDETHAFATEVHHPDRGFCDVLDLNQGESMAYIYEVETDCTKDQRRKKAMQYTDDATCDVIADCYVIDPTEAPQDIDDLKEWTRGEMPSVLAIR